MAASETAAKPPVLWREELKRAWRELRGADVTPARAALAVALGLFIGSQPPGLHTPLVVTICLLLQLDVLLAFVASNISNPLFAGFLYTFEVQLGGYLHTGAILPFNYETAQKAGVGGFFLYWLTGSALTGLALAVVGGALVYVFVAAKQRLSPGSPRERYELPAHAPAWWHAVERVANRYQPVPIGSTPAERTRFHYVRIKLLGDPVTKMIADLYDSLGDVLDIGTGRGQIPIVLLELGRARRVHGIDWDKGKIEAAQRAVELEPTLAAATFEVADATAAGLPASDTVLLIDVIHYLSIAEQDDLLDRAARAVRPGGRIVVREADTKRGWRSWLTLGEELFFTTLRFNRGARVRFRPAGEIAARLEAAGLVTEVRPAWGKTPFSNVLVIGSRPD
ncbi:MAG TPA: DUF2062 domain-containing protein [Polyangiaceae bacterium]|nr:DUF2062 domain-containing protein [Polyangiaceae bacterium]